MLELLISRKSDKNGGAGELPYAPWRGFRATTGRPGPDGAAAAKEAASQVLAGPKPEPRFSSGVWFF